MQAHIIIKRDGTQQQFNKNKIIEAIRKAQHTHEITTKNLAETVAETISNEHNTH